MVVVAAASASLIRSKRLLAVARGVARRGSVRRRLVVRGRPLETRMGRRG